MPCVTSTELGEVLSGLLQSFAAESEGLRQQLHDEPAVQEAVAAIASHDVGAFHAALAGRLERLVDGILYHHAPHGGEAHFLLKRGQFVEMQLRARIEEFEGMPCAADKTRFLLRGLLSYYMTGREIVFDCDQKYTFHLPRQVLCSHQEVVAFFEAVRALYYGDPQRYLRIVAG